MNNIDLRSSGVILLILGVKVDTYKKSKLNTINFFKTFGQLL